MTVHLPPALLALCLLLAACGSVEDNAGRPCGDVRLPVIASPELDLRAPDVSRHNLRTWVELFTSPQLRGRHAGEDGARHAAALLAAQMARVGLVPPSSAKDVPSRPRGDGNYCQGFPFLGGEDYNVVGILPRLSPSGGPPAAPTEAPAILLSAHYDGQGVHPAGMIYPGADDNASGVAALLEVARLTALGTGDPRIAWTFAAFGAEEGGRQGSRAYLSAPAIALPRVELAVNLDMIGRSFPGPRRDAVGYLASGRGLPATLARLRAAASASGLEVRSLEESGALMPTISDAHVLATRWPTLLLSTALHQDHHQLTDTPEKINYGQIERTARLVLELGAIIAAL